MIKHYNNIKTKQNHIIDLILIQAHLLRFVKSNPVFFFFLKKNILLTELVFMNNSLSFLLHLHLESLSG